MDPLVDETGTPYAFTNGDPVNGSDPDGLCALCIFIPWSDADPIHQYAYSHSNAICAQIGNGFLYSACNQLPGTAQYADAHNGLPCAPGTATALGINFGNLKGLSKSQIKQLKEEGVDPEVEKQEIYGKNYSKYDIYRDTTNGDLIAGPHIPDPEAEYQPIGVRLWDGDVSFGFPETGGGVEGGGE